MNWHFKCGGLSGCVILISALLSACNREVKTDEFKNTTYTLEEEYIKVDADTGIRYVDNVLLVYFEPGIEDSDKKDIIHSVGGKIVGFIPQWTIIRLRLRNPI
ncbi:hypothetical protein [Clostridium sp. AM58-1XD]|uniref:S8 family serine peptidase n=1 Tax=Clostridium sp. AM58-1XD TaxID=2292307 RepID=UPI000E526FA8|nr:hypothetical protein [Clostridium sp. AM58-1XD]RGZ00132.1 hypothetical protein DXA13_05840 [Clostridium sp. AM58-1XD]